MSMSSSGRLENAHVPRSSSYLGPFGRMFSKLPPWIPPGKDDTAKNKNIEDFANTKMTTKAERPINKNLPAGYTYFGQFIDHDITFDPTSSLQRQNDPNIIKNFRSPRLDLDSLYGEGPDDEPFMYDRDEEDEEGFTGYLLTGKGRVPQSHAATNEDDLPRNKQGRALIGDMRNDENVIISQLQLAFIKFHNRVMKALDNSDDTKIKAMTSRERFQHAQELVRWTYQYVVWNDYLDRLIDPKIHKSLLPVTPKKKTARGMAHSFAGKYYKWEREPFIPVEFSVAAFRMGHSMVRSEYQVNESATFGRGKKIRIFPAHENDKSLKGFGFLRPEHTLQWDWFVNLATSEFPIFPQLSQKIDMQLSEALFQIPSGKGKTNILAVLNIRRNWRMGVPGGTAIAEKMGIKPLKLDDPMEDCLWVYILKEAQKKEKGKRLGPVGSRIVGEVLAGLLYGDPTSYIRNKPRWTPEPVAKLLNIKGPVNKTWELADIIVFAGVNEKPF